MNAFKISNQIVYIIIIFVIMCAGWSRVTYGKNQSSGIINVLLKESCSSVNIRCSGWIEITSDSEESLKLPCSEFGLPISIKPSSSGISINDFEIDLRTIHLNNVAENNPLQIDDYAYRGEIIILVDSQWKLKVINSLDLNSYLCGIMKSEISPDWPDEVLKAQAIIARTYALREISLQKYDAYDLKASIDSQVYIGMTGEDPRTNRAVHETEHYILTLNGEIFPAFYHACCGGHTESAQNIFGDYPSVIGIACDYCSNSPHFEWEYIITPIELRNILLRNDYRADPIKTIEIVNRYPAGRVNQLSIKYNPSQSSSSRLLIKGKKLRELLGYDTLRSSNFTVNFKNGHFIFHGKGWGHGVGLCQWGAKSMGEIGARYEEILNKYYPYAEITRIEAY
ncbi:MAG: SpoIID/LytB domain-containing protein [bacterium]